MELKLAFIGFGNVARAFARIINERKAQLDNRYDLSFRTVAIATGNHGCIVSDSDIDLDEAAARIEGGQKLSGMAGSIDACDTTELIDSCDADIIFETTPLDPTAGEPATTYALKALARGINVITANKGPIAFAYRDLKSLASDNQVSFRFEGTVMDGAPIFNLVEQCLPAVRVTGFSGVLNSTTNIILSGMEAGRSFDECLDEARRRGITESNADYDIEGWDASVKAAALANVLLEADLRPRDVERVGISDVSYEQVRRAARSANAIRLIARAIITGGLVKLSVKPETVSAASVYGALTGASNALVIETDMMGEITIIESNPGLEQTAYALLSDMIRVRQDMIEKKRVL